jgi:hypothetical protein
MPEEDEENKHYCPIHKQWLYKGSYLSTGSQGPCFSQSRETMSALKSRVQLILSSQITNMLTLFYLGGGSLH